MDYKEMYEKALERAKKFEKKYGGGYAALIFPELRESEDERTRKAIINYFECQKRDEPTRAALLDKWIAYLEKQKEQKPKQEPKWLYRLEFKDKSCGLWYNGKGEWCFESGIGSLDDSCKTKTLPMDYDERYKADGRDWFSSCSRKEDLLHWYSKEDARILLRKGFVFTKYLATEYTEYEQQTVFIKETALYREEIDFFSLFNEQKPAEDNPFTPLEGIDAIKAKYYDDGFKNGFDEGVDSVAPVEWSEEDKEHLESVIHRTEVYAGGCLYERIKEDFDWLKELPNRIQLQSKSEWSEEDERKRLACIDTINEVIDYERDRWEDYNPGKPYRPITKYDEQIDWLKSLRPQPKAEWSAADEETLNDAIGVVENYGYLSLARRLKSIHPQPIDERLRSGELLTQEHHQKLMDALHDTMLKGEEERTKLLAKEYEENLEKAYKNRDEVVFREGKEKGREEMMEEMEARETQSHAKGYDAGLKDGIAMAKAEYEKEWVAELEKKYPDLDGYKQGVSDGRLLSQITADDVGKIFNLVRIMQKKYAATEGCFQPVADKFNEERK